MQPLKRNEAPFWTIWLSGLALLALPQLIAHPDTVTRPAGALYTLFNSIPFALLALYARAVSREAWLSRRARLANYAGVGTALAAVVLCAMLWTMSSDYFITWSIGISAAAVPLGAGLYLLFTPPRQGLI